MAKMVQISEELLSVAAFLLMQFEIEERNKAAQLSHARKPGQSNKRWNKAQEIRALLDDIAAVLDPKE